ncbi:MAG TPA: hypothetical protein VMU55_04535 [Solirubrobacteraceae bacterium]|nr:hypothetical protein [Solirubrobacteraceae bacterium]
MNDYLGQLQQALSDAARREYGSHAGSRGSRREPMLAVDGSGFRARRARLRSLRRWPPFTLAALALTVSATATAAIVVLVDRGSAPLSGTVPSLRALHYDVPLTPDLEAGDAGWCSDPRFSITSVRSPYSGGGACAPSYRPGTPILLAGGEPISNAENLLKSSHTPVTAQQGHTNLFWAIVTSRVAALRLSPGHVVLARRDGRLPSGWKAIIAFVSGQIDPVALDSAGRVIPGSPNGGPPTIARAPTRSVEPGSPTASSPCSIHAPRLPYVTASWGVLATRVPTLGSSVTGNVLFSCARSWYSVKGYTEAPSAAILLSAQDPRRAAPALPGLTPTGRPGIFAEDGGADGPLLATRVGRAWLVVQGPSTSIDAMLLGALRAEGTAVGSTGRR